MVRRTLPVIAAATKILRQPDSEDDKNGYLDAKLMHYASVETDHPYKQTNVAHFKVQFPDSVQWMSLELDSKCGFAQPEDKLASLLIPCKSNFSQEQSVNSKPTDTTVTKMFGVTFDDLYSNFQHFGLDTPAGLVVLPGKT